MSEVETTAASPAGPPAAPRRAPENTALLILTALLVGFVVGHALGRRQGLVVQEITLPEETVAAMRADEASAAGSEPPSDDLAEAEAALAEAALAETAPESPETLDEARAMVAQMTDSTAEELIALGDRKFGNDHPILAAAFYEAAVQRDAANAHAWLNLGLSYQALGEAQPARLALRKVLDLEPEGERADAARAALAELDAKPTAEPDAES